MIDGGMLGEVSRWGKTVEPRRTIQVYSTQPRGDFPRAGAAELSIYHNIVDACQRTNIIAILTSVSHQNFSLVVDTGATVNVISDESYQALKRSARGGRWPLLKSDLNPRFSVIKKFPIGWRCVFQWRFLMHIHVDNDLCHAGPKKVKRLAVETTLSTVSVGYVTSTLVVNTTGGPVRVKHGVFLWEGLVYDRKVVPEPLELPTACVATLQKSAVDIEQGLDPTLISTLCSLVNVVDYPELKHSLLKLLGQYRDVIALPGETLGGTDKAEHHIKLSPGTKPVYILANRLPHSQRAVADTHVEEIFDTGVGGFTFADQYLQVSTRLASRNLYGLGEGHHESFKHDLNYRTWPMFARDQPPGPQMPVDPCQQKMGKPLAWHAEQCNAAPGENLYGVHPVYMVVEETGEAHMVLWLNSNAMEAETLPLPGLTLRAIGGVMDMYFFLGPSPTQALQQYTSTIGLPVMPPYWALGFQLCR
ncbi:Sucrase-isomaltase, intestinal [Chionoecetes opilio]|uniref:Sucrase-isomaltase, intestinal n=1 Tax=Chionoecetes opilio TaxID=41210 RepID=A0A8J4YFI7_CHIOP|nr:Sucrase-isomaltase, intestinal [Chionoecetes opilio]